MAELNLYQLLSDAQMRWLKPAEICELLNNYKELPLSTDAPNKPESGSLFLFDRSKLRYFRKDGHNWRKKKDGKTVREAHEKLKAGSKDVIHCYYAHGEDNPKFQRRSYWLLERGYEHIVLVHYREVTEGNRSEIFQGTCHAPSLEGSSITDLSQMPFQKIVSTSTPDSMHSSLVSSPSDRLSSSLNPYEDVDATESGEEWEDFQMASVQHSMDQPVSPLEQLTRELGLKTTACQQGQDASFLGSKLSNVAAASRRMAYSSYSNVPNAATFDVTQLQHEVQFQTAANKKSFDLQLSYKGDLEILEHMDMSDLLQDTDGCTHSNKISTSDTFDSSSWSSLLESTFGSEDKPMGLSEHLEQSTAPHTVKILGSAAPNVLSNSAFTEMRGMRGLPLKGIERQTETALEAQLGIVTEQGPFSKDAGKPIKEFQSPQDTKPGALKGKNVLYECKPWQPEEYIQDQSQHPMHPNQEQLLMNGKPFDIGIEIQSIDSGLLSPHVSELMQSIQFDGVNSIEKENFPENLGNWMPKELEDDGLNPLPVDSSKFPECWLQCEDQYTVTGDSRLSETTQLKDPLLLQPKRFSILDFTPEWSYCSDEMKVIVTVDILSIPSGTRWCCFFGGIEVPAEDLLSGVLRCKAPIHEPGRVPFYVTSTDRVFCSEPREFEFRSKSSSFRGESETDRWSLQKEQEMLLQIQFARLLSTNDSVFPMCGQEDSYDVHQTNKQEDKVGSLMVDESAWIHMENLAKENKQSFADAKEKLLHTLLKSKLQQWLVIRSTDPKGVSILDDHGLGVLHMAAALGYEWAVTAMLAFGCGINFRDAHGWTGLHWAAHFGREKLVAFFIAAGADPGALTDPSPGNPTGRTAADLAASNGHGGIAGYLAETSLTSHLSSLNLRDGKADMGFTTVSGDNAAVEAVSEKSTVSASSGVTEDQLSMKDTLAAVRNASQAAARIQAAFRAYSFRKRQEIDDSNINEFGVLEEVGRDFVAAQTVPRASHGQHDKMNLAATQIQCKYRGWKGRKDFLFLKKHVLRIQAHVRGHQVRKKYPKLLWTVGVLDKVILRWRRKGSGLRGFHCEEECDDEDFLRDFRRQKEEAFAEALNRVKVMLQDPQARNQYRRMLEIYQNEKGALSSENLILPDDELMRLLE